MKMLRRIGWPLLNTLIGFPVCVAVGISLGMLFLSSIGYLPYSDRPGPGWFGPPHWPHWQEIGTYLGFIPFFAYSGIFFGAGLFLIALGLSFAAAPRWLWRVIGGLLGCVFAAITTMGAGWLIALSAAGEYAGLFAGILYGIFLFPKAEIPFQQQRRMWLRVAVPLLILCTTIGYFIRPFLPHTPVPQVALELNRITPGNKALPIWDTRFLGAEISKEVASLGLVGDAHGGISEGGGGNSNSRSQINILLLVLEPIDREYKLSLPKTGYIVYVLKDHQWTAHPGFNQTDSRKLIIRPGIDNKYDGGQIRLGDAKSFSSFTWYPAILKTH